MKGDGGAAASGGFGAWPKRELSGIACGANPAAEGDDPIKSRLDSAGGGAVGVATEKGLDAVTAGAAMKGLAIVAPAKPPPATAAGENPEGGAPLELGSAGGGASGVIAMEKGEG